MSSPTGFLPVVTLFATLIATLNADNVVSENTMAINSTFKYFAFGSNLLAERIHISNPSAVRKNHAKLQGYRLDFAGFSRRWGGAVATIEPDSGAEMWGAVWELDHSHMESLDRQEGVPNGVYVPLTVNVTTEDGENLECRSYRYNLRSPLEAAGVPFASLPNSRKPSSLYRETILRGAAQSGLPQSYQDLLQTIPSNNHNAGMTLDEFLAQPKLTNKKD